MNTIKLIRERLGITQSRLAAGMGCTQGNVGHYERGQTVPPDAAKRLIEFASELGHVVTYDDIYGAPEQAQAPATEPAPIGESDAARTGTVHRQVHCAKDQSLEVDRCRPNSPLKSVTEDQAVIVAVLVAAPKAENTQQSDHRAIPTRRTDIPSPYDHSDIDRRDEEVHGRRVNNGDAVDVVVKGF